MVALSATASVAAVRELSQLDLRLRVATGQIMSLAKIADIIERQRGGDIIDVRAFEIDGVYYRLVLKKPNGKLAAAVLDAKTGKSLSRKSAVAKKVAQAVKASRESET